MSGEEEYDAVIAGCGLSGLTAAYTLLKQKPGLRVCIVEARERVGGRLKTVLNSEGKEVDMGGSWVGPRQTNITTLLEELHVDTYPQYLEGHNIHDDGKTLHTYTGTIPSISLLSLVDTHFMLGKLDKLVRTIDLQDPQLCPKARQWDAVSLFEFGRKNAWTNQAQSLLSIASRLVLGYESEQVSLLYFLYYCATAGGTRPLLDSDGGGQDSRLKGGTQQLLSTLKSFVENASCCIHFGTTIDAVDYDYSSSESNNFIKLSCKPTGTTTTTGTDTTTTAAVMKIATRRLVMCIPPSCLSHIHFNPCPAPWKQSLWNRSKAGCYIKIIVFYRTAFWRQDGFSGSCICEHSNVADGRPLVGVFDYCDEGGGGTEGGTDGDGDGGVNGSDRGQGSFALCCFVCGSVGEDFSALTLQHQRASVCAHLEVLFGKEAREEHVKEMLIMDWLHDADGSPAFGGGGCPVDISALGFFRKHVEQLRKPLYRPSSPSSPNINTNTNNNTADDTKNSNSNSSMSDTNKADMKKEEKVMEPENITVENSCPVVFFGGTETALQWAGYMDGAVESGIRVAREALSSLFDK